jgi:hypothetical protein
MGRKYLLLGEMASLFRARAPLDSAGAGCGWRPGKLLGVIRDQRSGSSSAGSPPGRRSSAPGGKMSYKLVVVASRGGLSIRIRASCKKPAPPGRRSTISAPPMNFDCNSFKSTDIWWLVTNK